MPLNRSHRATVRVMTHLDCYTIRLLFIEANRRADYITLRSSSTLPPVGLLSLEAIDLCLHHFLPPTEQNGTFCAASSSLSLACSCCIRLSSSCCPWKRMSKALLPLGSTGELSGLRSFQGPIMSRTRGLLGRDGLRAKSKVKADPKESERKPRDLPNFPSTQCSNTGHSELNYVQQGGDVRLCVSGGFCSGKSLGGASTSSHSSALLLLPV